MVEKYSFENYIMQCCKAREWDLRKFLKRVLTKHGFNITEDDFATYRGHKYSSVHNMLAIRGKPRVCLVAHTDVCRDHAQDVPVVNPAMKIVKINDNVRTIIQDKECAVQVGGDDRLGVAINTWIATNTGYDMALLFTTDEEVGLISAEYVKFPELLDFDLLVEVDRGNHSEQLVTNISGHQLCSDEVARRLLNISEQIGLPRYQIQGFLTDVLAIKTNHMCKNAVNMTCGYHNSYGAEDDEYIDVQEAKDTMKYVANIVKYYYLEEDKTDDFSLSEEEEDQISSVEAAVFGEKYQERRNHRRYFDDTDLFSEESYEREKGDSYDMERCYPAYYER